MREVRIIDTTLRDAPQCLWATRMTAAMMMPVAETMDRAGFGRMDLAAAIQFDVCVRYLKENPWEKFRLLREKIVNTPLQATVRGRSLVSFDILPNDIIELWVERLVANGFRVVCAMDGLNDVDNLAVSLKVAKALGVTTEASLAFSQSPVHTDEHYASAAAEIIRRIGVDIVKIRDAGGLLTPDRIRTLVPALKRVLGKTRLALHSHCLTGLAPLVYLEGIKLGVDEVAASIAPLANGPAQPATQTFVRNARLLGFEIGVDLALADRVGEHFRRVADQEGLPLGVPVEYDEFHFTHQVPGGMLTNLKFQLEQAGLSERFDAVLEECARVREELGWPIMITPFSQLVGTQAVLNVVQGERYRVVPDEVKKYALGHYGRLLAPVKPDVLDKIIENGSSAIKETPAALEPAVPELRKQYAGQSDDERLLRFMFAGNQVDEMFAAGPLRTEYVFKNRAQRLLETALKAKKMRYISIAKDDVKLEAVRHQR
ncbi:MAG: carboxylase [Betaproteobacteria bacterium RIFCSPLOWO2_12_FULL_62_13]|nr:MAG: carboxylase [Betaproteobacteria bacterium RIFCSPLOWO2_12_FULL_62_13]